MSVAGRLERWLVAHPSNPLRLPEAPDPPRGRVYERLDAAARSGDVLFHGSNAREISEFQPREQMTARTILNPISFASAASSQTA
jgi:hypothetical protein